MSIYFEGEWPKFFDFCHMVGMLSDEAKKALRYLPKELPSEVWCDSRFLHRDKQEEQVYAGALAKLEEVANRNGRADVVFSLGESLMLAAAIKAAGCGERIPSPIGSAWPTTFLIMKVATRALRVAFEAGTAEDRHQAIRYLRESMESLDKELYEKENTR